ncbi:MULTISPECIES: hypothetical protein [Bacillus]|uniref:hypothetical protein n=1 Tax=Bacillus TaxID=1386 RepID=UPI000309A150|nr:MULTISPECIES: hypothetical protein [Bacillus]
MKSFVTYQLKNYIRSLIFIPPVAIYVTWVVILYAYQSNDILGSYANSAVGLYIIMTWISMNVSRLEEAAEKHILIVHLRQKEHFLYGKWATSIIMMLPLIIIAHIYPIISNSFTITVTTTDHILALYCHFGLGILGILTGSFFAATKITESKYVWLLCSLTITMSLAYTQIEALLPKGLTFILWVLPPLRFLYEPLKQSSENGLPIGFLAACSLSIFYMLIAGVVILKMFMRNERQ